MKNRSLLKLMSFWPPFIGSRIRVKRISDDIREIDVTLKLTFWNSNYVGTLFGGSIFSMTDPFHMLMLLENLGREYIVWDKGATIRFKKPGRGTVKCEFRLTEEQLRKIKDELKEKNKIEPVFYVEVKDEAGDVVAEVEKTLYVRRKN